ncbi:MAG: hypothetical protein GX936_00160 [Clostridiales bacterium]|nr:hypothetical protein [Clostridiales bacterium]
MKKRLFCFLVLASILCAIAPMTIMADPTVYPPALWDFGKNIGPTTAWLNFHNRGDHVLTDNSIILTVKAGQTAKPELNLKAADYSMKDMQWCRIRIKVLQGDNGRIDLYANKNGASFTANDMATITIDGTKSGYQTYIVNMPKANGYKAGGAWTDQTVYTTRLRLDYIGSTTAGDSREIDYIAFFPTYEAAIGWENEAGNATKIDENGTRTTVALTTATAGIAYKGVQESVIVDNKFSVRFIAAIDSLDYDTVGFDITATYTEAGIEQTKDLGKSCTYVFNKLLAGGSGGEMTEHTATNLGGQHLLALSVKEIPADIGDIRFVVTPYTIVDGVKRSGVSYTVVYTNGVFTNQVKSAGGAE